MYERVLLLALLAMRMSNPAPNIGPQHEDLNIACDGFVTMLLNGPRLSLLRSENMNALEVAVYLLLDSKEKQYKEE